MSYYSIYLDTEKQKYDLMAICRAHGATLADVSGCGSGYHITIEATPAQVERINTAWGAVA